MLNISDLLEQIKQNPYREIVVRTPHTGVVNFADIKQGDAVHGPEGQWKERSGTRLATLTRERNPKPIFDIKAFHLIALIVISDFAIS